MTSLLSTIQNISKSYGSQSLFEDISFGLFAEEKLGFIGQNGTGKSTLLKIIAGLEDADSGQVTFKKGLNCVYLAQQDLFEPSQSIQKILETALKKYHLQDTEIHVRTQKIIELGNFDSADQLVESLSGGWKKRLAICCALIQEPDLLLMDEPTNHLDIEGIFWLEDILSKASFAFVVITHDRYFLEKITNRILELSPIYPKGFLKTEGNYSTFLEKRENFLNEQKKQEETFSNKVRREVEWLQRGPKARTTKAKSRIEQAQKMQSDLGDLKQRNRAEKKVNFNFESNEKQAAVLLKAHHVTHGYGDKEIISQFSLKLSPGMCLGLVGRNGSGKSTLMNLLAERIQPNQGSIKLGMDVKRIYFTQDRTQLNLKQSVKEALSLSGGDTVIYQEKELHIITWARKFLFKPEQLNSSVSSLSGGEKARILIAQLMLQPADILLLDEPTNDLDIPSLEVLEKSLLEFPGAIVLVTHDRYLLGRLSTHILHFNGTSTPTLYADLEQCLKAENLNKSKVKKQTKENSSNHLQASPEKRTSHTSSKKLSFKEKHELENIEKVILEKEEKLQNLLEQVQEKSLLQKPQETISMYESINEIQQQIEQLYFRWQELETK